MYSLHETKVGQQIYAFICNQHHVTKNALLKRGWRLSGISHILISLSLCLLFLLFHVLTLLWLQISPLPLALHSPLCLTIPHHLTSPTHPYTCYNLPTCPIACLPYIACIYWITVIHVLPGGLSRFCLSVPPFWQFLSQNATIWSLYSPIRYRLKHRIEYISRYRIKHTDTDGIPGQYWLK